MVFLKDVYTCGLINLFRFRGCLPFSLFKQQALYIGTSKYYYRRELFRFEFHGLAAMREMLIPSDIIVFTFMAIYHSVYA